MEKTLLDKLGNLCDELRTVYDKLDDYTTGREDALNNMSGTNLENTERYQRLSDACDTLREATDGVLANLVSLECVEV